MDRVSTYPRYPCCPSPPPLEHAVSMTVGSCGDGANLCPYARLHPHFVRLRPVGTASAASPVRVHVGIPRSVSGPCRVSRVTVPFCRVPLAVPP